MGRPKRTETVRKTTIYLTRDQRSAAANIQSKLPAVRDIEIDSLTDAVGYSLMEVSGVVDEEFRVKSAATKPRM